MAAVGQEAATGLFEVEDVCFADMGPQAPLPSGRSPSKLCLVSGLNINGSARVSG